MPASNPSVADLSIRDMWTLVKYYITVTLAAAFIFAVPAALVFYRGVYGLKSTVGGGILDSWWVTGLVGGVILLVLSQYLGPILQEFGKLLTQTGHWAERATFFKRLLGLTLFISYCYLWVKHPMVAFSLFLFLIVPGEMVYEKYRQLLNEKLPEKDLEEAQQM